MKNATWKKNMKYRIKYIYNTDFYVKCVTDVRAINDIETFDAEIPEDFVGYEISYGTETITYNSYSVYRGDVISFKEAKEKFSDVKVSQKITEELIRNCKSTEELRKEFLEPVDLKEKFEEFVKECEAKDMSPDAIEVGIVITEKNQPYHIWSTDVIIPL